MRWTGPPIPTSIFPDVLRPWRFTEHITREGKAVTSSLPLQHHILSLVTHVPNLQLASLSTSLFVSTPVRRQYSTQGIIFDIYISVMTGDGSRMIVSAIPSNRHFQRWSSHSEGPPIGATTRRPSLPRVAVPLTVHRDDILGVPQGLRSGSGSGSAPNDKHRRATTPFRSYFSSIPESGSHQCLVPSSCLLSTVLHSPEIQHRT